MSIIRSIIIAIQLLCLGSFSTIAMRAEATATVHTEFTVIGWAGEIQDLAYRQKGKLVALKIPAYERSTTYKYSGPADLELHLARKDTPKDNPRIASVRLEPGVKRYTLLVSQSNDSYTARAIPDDEETFPYGQARLVNLCPFRVAIRCNQSTSIILAPQQAEVVAPRADTVLTTEAAYEQAPRWVRASDDFIAVPPGVQTSVFFVQSEADHFKSIDGVTRNLQMIILRESKADREGLPVAVHEQP